MKKYLIILILFLIGCEGPTEPVAKIISCGVNEIIVVGFDAHDSFWISYRGIENNTLKFLCGISNNKPMPFLIEEGLQKFSVTFKIKNKYEIEICRHNEYYLVLKIKEHKSGE